MTRSLLRWESLSGALAAAVTIALLVQTGVNSVSLAALGVLLAFVLMVGLTNPGGQLRLLAGYGLVWAGYAGSSRVVETLKLTTRDSQLLAADRALFGETPSVAVSRFIAPWQGDLLSFGYLSYQVYLHWVLVDACFRPGPWRERLAGQVYPAFAIGLAGYYVYPAASPSGAFPELYDHPLAGGWLMRANEALNTSAAARYDAFPSLHLLITLMLLAHDWRWQRWRFWTVLPPAMVMAVSTLALRLHYGVDLLASMAVFALLTAGLRSPDPTLSRP